MDGSNVQTIQVKSLLSSKTSETRQDGDESTETEQTGNVTTVTEHLTEKESSGYGSHDSLPIDSSQEQSLVNEKSDGSASPDCGVNIEFHLPTEATSCNLLGDPAVKRMKIHKTVSHTASYNQLLALKGSQLWQSRLSYVSLCNSASYN